MGEADAAGATAEPRPDQRICFIRELTKKVEPNRETFENPPNCSDSHLERVGPHSLIELNVFGCSKEPLRLRRAGEQAKPLLGSVFPVVARRP